jgi:hypothetical protein
MALVPPLAHVVPALLPGLLVVSVPASKVLASAPLWPLVAQPKTKPLSVASSPPCACRRVNRNVFAFIVALPDRGRSMAVTTWPSVPSLSAASRPELHHSCQRAIRAIATAGRQRR